MGLIVILLSPYENRVAKYAHTYIYIPKKTKKIEGKTRPERGENKTGKKGGRKETENRWGKQQRSVGTQNYGRPHVKNARST